MVSGRVQRRNSSDPGEREIVDHLVEHFETCSREVVVNYYIALKTKHFVILAGSPEVDKESLAQGLGEALVGCPGLPWSLTEGHRWWMSDVEAPRQRAEADPRCSTLKLQTFLHAASTSESFGFPFSFLAGIKELSPAEVGCYFEDLPRGLSWRADGSTAHVHLPANLFVTGTLNTNGGRMPFLAPGVHRHATVVHLGPDQCPPTGRPRRPSRPKVHWQQAFVTSGASSIGQARTKLSRILPDDCAPLANIESLAHRLGVPRLPPCVSTDAWLYLANAFDGRGRGLFLDPVVENLSTARDYVMAQSMLSLVGGRWSERSWRWEGVGDYLWGRFPRAYARCSAYSSTAGSAGDGGRRETGAQRRRQ